MSGESSLCQYTLSSGGLTPSFCDFHPVHGSAAPLGVCVAPVESNFSSSVFGRSCDLNQSGVLPCQSFDPWTAAFHSSTVVAGSPLPWGSLECAAATSTSSNPSASHCAFAYSSIGDPCIPSVGCRAESGLICDTAMGVCVLPSPSLGAACTSSEQCADGQYCAHASTTGDGGAVCTSVVPPGGACSWNTTGAAFDALFMVQPGPCSRGFLCFDPLAPYGIASAAAGTCVPLSSFPDGFEFRVDDNAGDSLIYVFAGANICSSGYAAVVPGPGGVSTGRAQCVAAWDWQASRASCDCPANPFLQSLVVDPTGSLRCLPLQSPTRCSYAPLAPFGRSVGAAIVSFNRCAATASGPSGVPCHPGSMYPGGCAYYTCYDAFAAVSQATAMYNPVYADYLDNAGLECMVESSLFATRYAAQRAGGGACTLPQAFKAAGWLCNATYSPAVPVRPSETQLPTYTLSRTPLPTFQPPAPAAAADGSGAVSPESHSPRLSAAATAAVVIAVVLGCAVVVVGTAMLVTRRRQRKSFNAVVNAETTPAVSPSIDLAENDAPSEHLTVELELSQLHPPAAASQAGVACASSGTQPESADALSPAAKATQAETEADSTKLLP